MLSIQIYIIYMTAPKVRTLQYITLVGFYSIPTNDIDRWYN